jgi:uncharacterized protein YeaO (DUF488 family)
MKTRIQIKHAYEAPTSGDGARFLVDRVWPRGIKKEALELTAWMRDLAPSTKLRKWFNHEPEKWPTFRQRYFDELRNKPEAWASLLEEVGGRKITLVFGAHDSEHNNAVALAQFLERKLNPRGPSKPNLAVAKNGGPS